MELDLNNLIELYTFYLCEGNVPLIRKKITKMR